MSASLLTADPANIVALRLAFAVMFAVASIAKWRAPGAFRDALRGYGFVPAPLVRPIARVLPPAELAAALGLACAPGSAIPVWVAMVLLAGFAAAMACALRRAAADAACGCGFGGARPRLRPALVARNLVLIALLLPCLAPVAPALRDLARAALAAPVLVLLLAAADALLAVPALKASRPISPATS